MSGTYRSIHLDGASAEVSLVADASFPRCSRCGDAVEFQLLHEAPEGRERRSQIVLYEIPHPDAITPIETSDASSVASRDNRASSYSHLTSDLARTRIHHAPFYADVVPDRLGTDIWVYVVQREGSADILAMGSCTSAQSAKETASIVMARLAEKNPRDTSSAAAS